MRSAPALLLSCALSFAPGCDSGDDGSTTNASSSGTDTNGTDTAGTTAGTSGATTGPAPGVGDPCDINTVMCDGGVNFCIVGLNDTEGTCYPPCAEAADCAGAGVPTYGCCTLDFSGDQVCLPPDETFDSTTCPG